MPELIEYPTYKKWEDIPDGIHTKTTLLRDYGLKLEKGQQSVGQKKKYNHKGKWEGEYYYLYDMNEAVPKKKPTDAQLAALEKARYMAEQLTVKCSKCGGRVERYRSWWTVTRKYWIENKMDEYTCGHCDDKARAIRWSKHILTVDNAVILDTETTALHGEIIEIAIIDMRGNVLLDQRIKPMGEMSQGAYDMHGISLDDLKDCPTFPEVYEQIKSAIGQNTVIIYNAEFDKQRLVDDCERHQLERIKFNHQCAMTWYAQWYGEWSNYFGSYKWQPLDGGHSALSDCRATLGVLKAMAKD